MIRFVEKAENISGIFSIKKNIIEDKRGYIERLFCATELMSWAGRPISQINKTFSEKKGTVKGFHFQCHPYSEAKLICCTQGKVMDFALDLRQKSATFGQIFMIELDSEIHNAILLPEGVAHGLQTITDDVEMLYFHSQPYKPEYESGVNIFDPTLQITLPLSCTNISNRDQSLPLFSEVKMQ